MAKGRAQRCTPEEILDPAGKLGGSGKQVRYVRLTSVPEFEPIQAALADLIQVAATRALMD